MYKCIKVNLIRDGYDPGETVWRPACGDASNDLPAPQVSKLFPNLQSPNTFIVTNDKLFASTIGFQMVHGSHSK